jgi:hypothetical protein
MEMTKLETLNARCALRIHAATFAKEARSVGIVAAETQSNAGVLAREIAVITAGFGRKVMLINARETSDTGVQGKTAAEFVSNAIVGFEGILEVRILRGSEAHRALNEGRQLTALLADLAELVDAVVFDLPAHDEAMPAIYAPIAAAALDAVLLVTLPTVTTNLKLEETISWLSESGAAILAIIANDRFNPTLGEEIVREAKRLRKLVPFLPGFAARQVAKFSALNRHH